MKYRSTCKEVIPVKQKLTCKCLQLNLHDLSVVSCAFVLDFMSLLNLSMRSQTTQFPNRSHYKEKAGHSTHQHPAAFQ